MGRLTEAQKKAVPRSERGIPHKSGTGSYPMPDAKRARAAIGFAAMHHGPALAAKMRRKAQRLGLVKSSGSKRTRSAFYGE